jgi:hypothetical protein
MAHPKDPVGYSAVRAILILDNCKQYGLKPSYALLEEIADGLADARPRKELLAAFETQNRLGYAAGAVLYSLAALRRLHPERASIRVAAFLAEDHFRRVNKTLPKAFNGRPWRMSDLRKLCEDGKESMKPIWHLCAAAMAQGLAGHKINTAFDPPLFEKTLALANSFAAVACEVGSCELSELWTPPAWLSLPPAPGITAPEKDAMVSHLVEKYIQNKGYQDR